MDEMAEFWNVTVTSISSFTDMEQVGSDQIRMSMIILQRKMCIHSLAA